MRAALGSMNRAKILGAMRALRLMGVDEVVPISVETGIEQPMSMAEMIDLALYRAKYSLEKINADLGVGIEGGVLFNVGYPIEGQVAVVIDKDGNVGLGFSSLFPLPIRFNDILRRESLGDVMERILGLKDIGKTYGAIGYLTRGRVTRIELSYQAVLMAIIPFIMRGFYGGLLKDKDLKKIIKTLSIMNY